MFRYDRLDELIKSTGKKKVFLCQQIGKGPTYLRDAKKQNTNIKEEELKILAEELGTTPEYLSGESDQKEKPASSIGDGHSEAAMNFWEQNKDLDEAGWKFLAEQSRIYKSLKKTGESE